MIVLLYKIWQAEEGVLGTCAGTLAAAKTCLQMPEHRRSVGYEKDSATF